MNAASRLGRRCEQTYKGISKITKSQDLLGVPFPQAAKVIKWASWMVIAEKLRRRAIHSSAFLW